MTYEHAEPVGRSVAASPVESFGIWLTSINQRNPGHLFQLEDYCPQFCGQRFLRLANLSDIKETGFQAPGRRFFEQAAGRDAGRKFLGVTTTVEFVGHDYQLNVI